MDHAYQALSFSALLKDFRSQGYQVVTFSCRHCQKIRRRRDPQARGQIMAFATSHGQGRPWQLWESRGAPGYERRPCDDLCGQPEYDLAPDDPAAVVFRCRNSSHPAEIRSQTWVISRAEKAISGGYDDVAV